MKFPTKLIFCLMILTPLMLNAQEAQPGVMPVFDSSTEEMTELEIDENLTQIDGYQPQGSEAAAFVEKGIINGEDWYQVDGSKYPYSVSVSIHVDDHRWCSGSLVGPYTVLTNAHCVYKDIQNNRGKLFSPTSFRVYAGGTKYGVTARGVKIYVAPGTEHIRNLEGNIITMDYAVIVLDKPLGRKNGYLGVKSNNQLRQGNKIFLLGFPGRKPEDRPWFSPGKVTSIRQGYFCHNADETDGSSGSPVLEQNDPHKLVGVNSFEDYSYSGSRRTFVCNGAVTHSRNALVNFVQKYRMVEPSEEELESIRQQESESFGRLINQIHGHLNGQGQNSGQGGRTSPNIDLGNVRQFLRPNQSQRKQTKSGE